MKKPDYTIPELVHNQSFRRMAEGTASPQEIREWSEWMEQSDENRRTAKAALAEIAGFGFDAPAMPELDIDQEWRRLRGDTMDSQKNIPLHRTRKPIAKRWLYWAVASVLLIGFGAYFWANVNSHSASEGAKLEQVVQCETIQTGAGEKKTLRFTNNSREAKIVLNSNSRLTYEIGLTQEQPIKISLRGEAFFDVEKGFSKTTPAFSVTTPSGVIKDLGTEFLVRADDDHSRVVLQEGLVEIAARNNGKVYQRFKLKRGEMVDFTGMNILRQRQVNSSFYTSWATGFVQFDKTAISDLLNYLKMRYNVKTVIHNSELTDITLEGAVYFDSLEELLRSVSDIAKIPVYQSKNRDIVFIGSPYNR